MKSRLQGANTDFKPPRFRVEFQEKKKQTRIAKKKDSGKKDKKKESGKNFKSTRILPGEIVLASTAKILST